MFSYRCSSISHRLSFIRHRFPQVLHRFSTGFLRFRIGVPCFRVGIPRFRMGLPLLRIARVLRCVYALFVFLFSRIWFLRFRIDWLFLQATKQIPQFSMRSARTLPEVSPTASGVLLADFARLVRTATHRLQKSLLKAQILIHPYRSF